jgi:hypothetical protein
MSSAIPDKSGISHPAGNNFRHQISPASGDDGSA